MMREATPYEIAMNNLIQLWRLLKEGNTTAALFQAGCIYGLAQTIDDEDSYNQVTTELYSMCDEYKLSW